LLDVFKIPRDARGRRVAFVTACRTCGVVFANPLPTDAELRSHYSADGDGTYAAARKRIATRQAAETRTAARDERALLFDALSSHFAVRQPRGGAKVLDFGCGDGKYLDVLQDVGWETFGIEPSTDAAFTRHTRLVDPPQDGTFDFAMLHHVLEHVTRSLHVLRQIAGALRADGVLFLSVPRLDTLPDHGDFKYCLDGRNHVVAFTEAALRHLLAAAGFGRADVVESAELDGTLTGGKRLRLRMIASKAGHYVRTSDPYREALRALGRYGRQRDGPLWYVRCMVPVRARGALLDRAVEWRAQERRRART
jgi:SAM-dependent methyltransferase